MGVTVSHYMPRFLRWLGVVLGSLFLAAGAGKAFLLNAFVQTVSSIVFLSDQASTILAIVVIAFEIVGGILLIIGKWRRAVALLFLILLAVFIWILSSAILQGKEIACNCFGVLGLALTNRSEFLLDFLLFNGFAVLAYIPSSSANATVSIPGRGGIWRTILLALVFFLLQILFVVSVLNSGIHHMQIRIEPVLDFAAEADPRFAETSSNQAIFLMSYVDLNCPLCFGDFSLLVDSLAAREKGRLRDHHTVIVMKMDEFISDSSSVRLKRWARANDIPFPILVASDSLYREANFSKSCLLIVAPGRRLLFAEQFPMGPEKRKKAVALVGKTQ